MRPTTTSSLIAATLLLASPILTGEAAAQNSPAPTSPSKTQQFEQDATTVAKSPLKDVGVLKDKIPQVLIDARTETYALPSPLTCQTILAAIQALDAELAPDLDAPSTQIKTGMSAGEIGQTVVHGLTPMRSWVRKLSGAEKNANEVEAAIVAGSVRRGYLKGVGLARGCKPPAAPLGVSLPTAAAKPKKR